MPPFLCFSSQVKKHQNAGHRSFHFLEWTTNHGESSSRLQFGRSRLNVKRQNRLTKEVFVCIANTDNWDLTEGDLTGSLCFTSLKKWAPFLAPTVARGPRLLNFPQPNAHRCTPQSPVSFHFHWGPTDPSETIHPDPCTSRNSFFPLQARAGGAGDLTSKSLGLEIGLQSAGS